MESRNTSRKRIYLAGKVAKNDWRHTVVTGLNRTLLGGCGDYSDEHFNWPLLEGAVFGMDYTGPYFVSDDHGCFHSEKNSHGIGASTSPYYEEKTPFIRERQRKTVSCCKDAIRRSDIIFAWIDDATCYGTLAEIGYAKGLGRTIWMASPGELWPDGDLWFAFHFADLRLCEEWLTPEIALRTFLMKESYTADADQKNRIVDRH